MIPGGQFTNPPLPGDFLPPLNAAYRPMRFTCMGGDEIGDSSKGRLFREWTAVCDGIETALYSTKNPSVAAFTLGTPGATSVSLAFDNNMTPVIAWTDFSGAKIYFYDPVSMGVVVTEFLGVQSCRLCVDDARDFYNADSDVIFGYTKNNNLYYSRQRDRYQSEILIGLTTHKLIKLGMNTGNRLQFELI